MIEKSLWQHIKDLVGCDKRIATIQNETTQIQAEFEKDLSLGMQLEKILKDKQHELFTMQKELQLKELNIRELKESEDHKRDQLERVKDQKGYKALEKEISNLFKERQELEEEVLKQLYNVDALKNELEQLKTQQAQRASTQEHDKQIHEERLANLENQLLQAQQTRYAIMQKIPAEWRTQYERMKNSVPDPIVPVLNSSCSACYYAILYHDLSKLKKSQLVICRNCYRFLYYDEETEKDATREQY